MNLLNGHVHDDNIRSMLMQSRWPQWNRFRHRVISNDTMLHDMLKVYNPVDIWYPRPLHGLRLNMLSGLLEPYLRVQHNYA